VLVSFTFEESLLGLCGDLVDWLLQL